MDDIELLQQYAIQNSQEAFATLVSRHVNMVYSVALRQLNNSHHAEEVTQAVFAILAKKSGSLRQGTILSGWLYQTARLTARNFLRGEIRRQQREQEAYMQSLTQETEPEAWPQIAPFLDDAMAQLGEKDRDAIALRFFEGKNLREVGVELGVSEDAAKMRVGRAVDKLRGFFTKRGIALSATVVGSAILANSVQAAPAGLVSSATIAATQGFSLSVSTTTLIKGTLKLMAWTKTKIAIAAGAVALLAVGTATVVIINHGPDNSAEIARGILEKAQTAYSGFSSYECTGRITSEFDGMASGMPAMGQTFSIRMARPNLYQIEWEQKVPSVFTNKGAIWAAGEGDFSFLNNKTEKANDRKSSLTRTMGLSSGLTAVVPTAFFHTGVESALGSFARGTELARQKDERVGGADCYVLSSVQELPPAMASIGKGYRGTLWIGKEDHIIRQYRIAFDNFKIPVPGGGASRGSIKMISTQIFENIIVNGPLAKEAFVYAAPKN